MSIRYPQTFALADSPSIDAFGRLRVGAPVLLLDNKRVGGTPDLLATMAVTGSGATSYTITRASTYLTVGSAAGTAIRQTKARAVYQPGKSLLMFQTWILAPAQTNLNQRCGYFDAKNGVFLSLEGNTTNVVRRSFVSGVAVDTKIAQASWNLDTMLGGGGAANPSGITLDITKPQILVIDFEWLGVGRVRVGFVINGLMYYVHEFLNSNATLTSVYMSNPNLPVRWEIEATAGITGTASLECICASVNSEGGYDLNGLTASTDSGVAGRSIATVAFAELLAIRMQSTYTEFSTAFIQQLSTINTTSGAFRWRLVMNPTETVAGAWGAVSNSIMEGNSTRTVTQDTGIVVSSGYVSAQSNAVEAQARPVLTLGTTLAGVTDVFSLQVFNLSNQAETFLAPSHGARYTNMAIKYPAPVPLTSVTHIALTDGASIATDASLGGVFTVTLGGNRTLANPTGLVAGGTYLWRIQQDATGSRTLAYGTMFKFPGGTAPVLSTAAGSVDLISAYYDGTSLLAVAQKAFA